MCMHGAGRACTGAARIAFWGSHVHWAHSLEKVTDHWYRVRDLFNLFQDWEEIGEGRAWNSRGKMDLKSRRSINKFQVWVFDKHYFFPSLMQVHAVS